MVNAPKVPTRMITVIAGGEDACEANERHGAEPARECLLYTIFGGPPGEREPWDLDHMKQKDPEASREKSRLFWKGSRSGEVKSESQNEKGERGESPLSLFLFISNTGFRFAYCD
jgi:hypothetical protein